MNSTEPEFRDIRVTWALEELGHTIRFARIRCMTFHEILARLSQFDPADNHGAYVQRLSELTLTESDVESLVGVMNGLAGRAEREPSAIKLRIDKLLLRLVRLLPADVAMCFAEPFVKHRRKARRMLAYSALRKKQVSKTMAANLANAFAKTREQEALQLIARNPERVPEVGGEFLLKNLDEPYWRTRVLEALLLYDRQNAISFAQLYPFEFAYAVGRCEDKSLLGHLCALVEANSNDLKFLSIYAYALGKLGGRQELDSLECFVREHWPSTET